jgi:hypothetical protein
MADTLGQDETRVKRIGSLACDANAGYRSGDGNFSGRLQSGEFEKVVLAGKFEPD